MALNRRHVVSKVAGVLALSAVLAAAPSCGGASGGAGPSGAGQGLVLVSFVQNGLDNVSLNTRLEFRFSEPVNALTVSNASIQIREGNAFGLTVFGQFLVQGSTVWFEPVLPGLCDLSDSGFLPGTKYRVQLVGHPEEFAIKNTQGQSLNTTQSFEFTTRDEQDPGKFIDQIPGAQPLVVQTSPANGEQAVTVEQGNQVVLTMSENLDPCTVDPTSVRFHIYQFGDPTGGVLAPNGNPSGFYFGGSTADQNPGDPYDWGASVSTTLPQPQRILASIDLVQSFQGTLIVLTPDFGEFPDNCLIVVELSFAIEDFGGAPLVPFVMSFTTENLPAVSGSYRLEVAGETPFDTETSTADINSARAPSKVQGYMLFAGDGDNGGVLTSPAKPETPASLCSLDRQANDGIKDIFDPPSPSNVLLDTGSTNTCLNDTDGSTAVIWEFASFRIRNGVNVRIVGVNPAIILVQGAILIENGGVLRVTGDNAGGAPNSRGGNGENTNSSTSPSAALGGVGVAGGGNGGNSKTVGGGTYGDDGRSGFGSPSGQGALGGVGAGQGNTAANKTSFSGGGTSASGGGGGHSLAGTAGTALLGPSTTFVGSARGAGGGVYPSGSNADRMLTPSSGSGGGAAGYADMTATSFAGYDSTGGAGGAGGGFVDLTSQAKIEVFGTIDATGGRGGNGAAGFYSGSGGGGGGSGGGVRLLTPDNINVNGGTVSTAGGTGGSGGVPTSGGGNINNGGAGSWGRIVMEDGDSVITGLTGGTVVPGEGSTGFYRGVFDATRFQGGGLEPQALTHPFGAGPLNPLFIDPVQNYGVQEDFKAGVTVVGSRGVGMTSILIEAQGYQILPDGGVDLGSATGFYTVGHFRDSGVVNLPTWHLGQPPGADIPTLPPGNVGAGITNLNGCEFIQLRITVYLPNTVGPFDAGPFLDRWDIRFNYGN